MVRSPWASLQRRMARKMTVPLDLPSFSLEDRVALVTGAGQGIGRAIALGLASAGAAVAILDANEAALRAVAEEIEATGQLALPLAADIREASAIERAMATLLARCGRVDVLVNNAGIRVHKPVLEHTLEDWEDVLRVNCTAPFLLCQAAARAMQTTGGGSIVNISSQMATVTSRDRVAYCASKAALNQMTRVMAVDWARFNIRVNAIGPGPIETPFTVSATASRRMPVDAAMVPMGRLGRPQEVVGAVLYLASDAASFVTGAFLVVDGGQSVLWR
jgi:NAD(P)-dependent dehydrogenase (short-subunit alcohol dehydrogenase family)